MAAGKRAMQWLVASMMVGGVLVLTSQAASAAQSGDRSVSCSLSGVVHFSPPLTRSGGGTHASRVTATLSYCTYNSGIVEAVYSAHLGGIFASSPFSCSSSSPTGAALSATVRWHAKAWPHGGIGPTTVERGSASGSFAGSAVVSLYMPPALASGCAGGKIRSAIVSGTISIGQECGGVDGPLTEYPMVPPICGGQNYMPTSITTGSDGALWFTTNRHALIGRMTTAGVTTLYPLPYMWDGEWGNGGITSGSDGALWFIANSGLAIGRITTSGSVSTFPLPARSGLADAITSGPDGALWFTVYNNAGPNAIGQLTTSGTMTLFTDPSLGTGDWSSSDHRELTDITSGPDGALWFTSEYASNIVGPGAASIGRITTSGVVSEFPIPFDANPGPLTTGPDGAIWFAGSDFFGGNSIGRVTTSGQFSEYGGSSGDIGQVLGLTAGPDGALWFTNYSVPGDTGFAPYPPIGRITTDGTITTYGSPYVEEGAMGITAGPDGAVWFNDHLNDSIGRVSVP